MQQFLKFITLTFYIRSTTSFVLAGGAKLQKMQKLRNDVERQEDCLRSEKKMFCLLSLGLWNIMATCSSAVSLVLSKYLGKTFTHQKFKKFENFAYCK